LSVVVIVVIDRFQAIERQQMTSITTIDNQILGIINTKPTNEN